MSETNNYAYSQGLLIPDTRLTHANAYSETYSSVTQAGPKAGDPVAQQQTDMVLDATGDQSAHTATGTIGALRLFCNEGGGVNDGRFVWRNAADATTLYRGWDPPWAISEHEVLDLATTGGKWTSPHAITLPNGKIVAVVDRLSGGNQIVQAAIRTTAGVWSNVTIYSATDSNGRFPCIARRADGRLCCYFWGETDTATSEVQVRMYFSDDDGATWALGQHDCLSEPLDVSVSGQRLRVAFLPNGHACLVASIFDTSTTYWSRLYQYASTQSGMSFALIDSTGWTGATDSTSGAYHDLTTVGGEIMLTYLRETGGTDYKPFCRFITAVNQRFSAAPDVNGYPSTSTAEWCTLSVAAYAGGDVTVVLDDVGYLYMIGRDITSTTREGIIYRSVNNGRTWTCPSTSDHTDGEGKWYDGDDGAIYPVDLCATMQGGRVVILHTMSTDAATTDPSLCATYLGGYSTVTLPSRKVDRSISYQTCWQRTWLGTFSEPDDAATTWTEGGVASTKSFTASGLRVQDAGAGLSTTYYYANPATTHTQGLISLTEVKVTSGTAYIMMRTSDATPVSYQVQVNITPTAITLRDSTPADIGTAETTTAATTGVQILIALGNADAGLGATGKVYAWWRATGGVCSGDRAWELIGSLGTSSTLPAGATATDHIQFGILAANGTDATFKMHAYTYGAYTGRQLYGGQTNPADLMGRVFAATPTWVDDGVRIQARSGPASYGDVWFVNTRYTHGIANIFPEVSSSPSRQWRSTGETQQDIVLEWNATLNQDTRTIGASVVAVFLTGCNFQTFEIASYNGAYNTEYSGDTSYGQKNLCFVREGDMVRPSSSVAGTPSNEWYTYHVLAGSHIRLDDNAGEPNVVIRQIEWNSEGGWRQNNSTTHIARLLLSDTVSTDPTGNGTQLADILSKDICVIMPAFGASTRIRIRIPAQDTAEGYFTIGNMLIGHVAYFGQRYGDGRQLETEPIFETVENRAGVRRSTKLGTPRRKVTVAWPTTDASGIGGTAPTPAYHASYTGLEPVAVPADIAFKILGIVEAQSGAVRPVVYLPRIDRVAAYSASCIVNRNLMLYSTITSIGSVAQVLGNEWTNPGEVLEIRPVTFEEQV